MGVERHAGRMVTLEPMVRDALASNMEIPRVICSQCKNGLNLEGKLTQVILVLAGPRRVDCHPAIMNKQVLEVNRSNLEYRLVGDFVTSEMIYWLLLTHS